MRTFAWARVAELRKLPSSEQANLLALLALFLNFLLFCVTAILAFYAYRQWVAVDRTLQEIEKQTPAVIEAGKAAKSSAETASTEAASSGASTQTTLSEMKKQSAASQTLANSTKEMAATAMRQLDLAERPMLVISDAKVESLSVNSVATVSYSLLLDVDNEGRSPATDTALLSDLIIQFQKSTFSPRAEMLRTCHKLDRVGPLAGEMIPPNGKGFRIARQINIASRGSLRNALTNAHPDPQTGRVQVATTITVCLVYRSTISSQVHHTALIYDLALDFSKNDVSLIQSGTMEPTEPIALWPQQLLLHKMELMNGFAD